MTRRKFAGAKRHDAETQYHDDGIDALVKKLRAWLIAQPEWVAVLSADRQTRKRYGARVADEVTRIPPMVRVVRKP